MRLLYLIVICPVVVCGGVPVVAVGEAVPVSGPTGPGTQTGFPKSCTSGVSKIKNRLVVHGSVPVVAIG